MRFRADISVNALQELERLMDCPAARGGGHAFMQVMSGIDRLLRVLEWHVPRHDEFGLDVLADEELIFRAARLIIATHLDRLDHAFRSSVIASMSDRAAHWSRFLEVIPVARAELGRITSLWLGHRSIDPSSRSAAMEPGPYVGALRKVCDELHAMEQVPEIERMLYRGVASLQHDIAAPCEQILVAMRVRADLPPARRQWLAHVRWAQVAQTAGALAGAERVSKDHIETEDR